MNRLMVRQMCGGGTWKRAHWKPRRTTKAIVFDAPGIAIAWGHPEHWGPFRFRLHGKVRDRLRDRFGSPRCWWPRGHQPLRVSDQYVEIVVCERCGKWLA